MLQVTSFSVHKNGESDSLITWPRILNAFSANLPPLLQNPSSFAHITPTFDALSAFYMYIQNMCHSVLLPGHLADLFHFPPISLLTLNAYILKYIANSLNLNLCEDFILRSIQATLLMALRVASS